MAKKRQTVSDQLRAAILNAEETQYRMAATIGVNRSVLSKFTNNKGGLDSGTIDKLCDHLGLELRLKGDK